MILVSLNYSWHNLTRLKPPGGAPGAARTRRTACVALSVELCECVCVARSKVCGGVHCVPTCGVWLRGVGRVSRSAGQVPTLSTPAPAHESKTMHADL